MAVTVFVRICRKFRERMIGEAVRLTKDDLLRLSPPELVRLRYIANAENLHERSTAGGEVIFEE